MTVSPFMMWLLAVAIVCAVVALFGIHYAKQEREEYRARHRR